MKDNIVQMIKETIIISDIVKEVVQISSSGFCKCPFHKDNTPSCKIDNTKGMYYCFGCGESGDVITFVQKIYNMSFIDSINFLADKAGITIQSFNKIENNAYKILESTVKWFQNNLDTYKHAKNYLYNRALTDETIKIFCLGYAHSSRTALHDHLSLSFNAQELEESGLFLEKSNKARFVDRIMFPIYDKNKRCVGFGGRILSEKDNVAKYINSPETKLFHKSKLLYAHHLARGAKNIYVVEGYFDVITLYQNDIKAVAPLGTAISTDHIQTCWHLNNSPIFMFDGDMAGQKAIERTVYKTLPELKTEYTIRFAKLPLGYDPDTFCKKYNNLDNLEIVEIQDILLNKVQNTINDSPYMLAQSYKTLRNAIDSIVDENVKLAYKQYFKDKVFNTQSSLNYTKNPQKPPINNKEPYQGKFINITKPDKTTIKKLHTILLIACLIKNEQLLSDDIIIMLDKMQCEQNLMTIKQLIIEYYNNKLKHGVDSLYIYIKNKYDIDHILQRSFVAMHNIMKQSEDQKQHWIDIYNRL